MANNIPTHVVLDSRDGHLWYRDPKNKAFTLDSARDFASVVNTTLRTPVYVVCTLTVTPI